MKKKSQKPQSVIPGLYNEKKMETGNWEHIGHLAAEQKTQGRPCPKK